MFFAAASPFRRECDRGQIASAKVVTFDSRRDGLARLVWTGILSQGLSVQNRGRRLRCLVRSSVQLRLFARSSQRSFCSSSQSSSRTFSGLLDSCAWSTGLFCWPVSPLDFF